MQIFNVYIILSSHLAVHTVRGCYLLVSFFFVILVGCQVEQKACWSKLCFFFIGSCMKHLPYFSVKYSSIWIRDDCVNRTGFVHSFVCPCVTYIKVLCYLFLFHFSHFKSQLESLNVFLTNSEKFDILPRDTDTHLKCVGQSWADVLLYRASPNRVFEASKLGHPACDSGISSNTN